MRARKKPWTQEELATNERIIENPKALKGNWQQYFQNNKPIHLEIGCGKGRFITETAAKNLDVNYIALEREQHVIVMGAKAARVLTCQLAFILGDVADLENYFAPGEIKRLYINFCDPWPNRKKWEKRRLTHRTFLDAYRLMFGGKGEIFFKTDSRQLFEFSLNEFADNGWRLRHITLDLHNSGFEGNIMTEYEEKFSSQGLPIYRCEAVIPHTIEACDCDR